MIYQDIERSASGETMEDDLMLVDIDLSLGVPSPVTTAPPKKPIDNNEDVEPARHSVSSNDDGTLDTMKEVESNLDRKEKVVSILKNKNPTPVKRHSLEQEQTGDGGSLRRNRPANYNRECCFIL